MAVKGFDVFRRWFASHSDKYVLIGGTAASVVMEAEELTFRATRDLDVVLIVEALTAEFSDAFWAFIQAGGYQVQSAGECGRRTFYRFGKPGDDAFPDMLELFARKPDLLRPVHEGWLTPIPIEDAVCSLSAILLDDDYYAFILAGRRTVDGVPMIGEDRLIPLKALAWLELKERARQGEKIDSRNVRKHLNDVLRLSQLLAEGRVIPVEQRVAWDVNRFLDAAAGENVDLAHLGFKRATLPQILERIAHAFGIASGPPAIGHPP